MGKKWKSYIYILTMAFVLFVSGLYMTRDYMNTNTNDQKRIYNLDEYFNKQDTIIPEAHVVDEQNVLIDHATNQSEASKAEFVLKIENDFVVVYKTQDQNTCYMATGINISDLPENTIEELKIGKEILDEESLYFFLESHSS